MKTLVMMLCLAVPVAHANESDREHLATMITASGLSVTTDADVLILGGADAALSHGPWDEAQTHAFIEHYGYRPTMLPLTARLLDPGMDKGVEQQKGPQYVNFFQSHPDQTYYLYVNLPEEGDWRTNLGQQYEELTAPAFQDRLVESGFGRLAPVNRQLWRARLGLAAPVVPGGYL